MTTVSNNPRFNATFLLTTCAFQIPYGQAYTLLSTKWTFFSSIVVFEIGSAVCGAPNSIALIIGRAIAGIGGAGVFAGCFFIIAQATPLRKRSLFTGFIGGTFGIAAIVGPLIGKLFLLLRDYLTDVRVTHGALTTRVSWGWCFYSKQPLASLTRVNKPTDTQ